MLVGFGLSACSFTIVIGGFGKLLPEEWRSIAFGVGTGAGSFGQFLFSPLGVGLMDAYGWQTALLIFSGILLLILPLSLALATPPRPAGAPKPVATQSVKQALTEAFGHRSYVLLVLGFFTCGFQLAFVTVHLPSYLIDRGLSAQVGGWTLAVIGLFNIVGSLSVGLSRQPHAEALHPVDHLFRRARCIDRRVHLDAGQPTIGTLIFGAVTGLLWLSTVPPTSGAGRADVRDALAGHAVRLCVLQPSGRRLPRRAARRLRVRVLGLLQSGVVAVGVVRRAVGADQPADRRKAGGARRRRPAMHVHNRHARPAPGAHGTELSSNRKARSRPVATFKAIVIEKTGRAAPRPR